MSGAARPGRLARLRVGQWLGLTAGVLLVVGLAGIIAGIVAVTRLGDARDLLVDRLDPAATEALRLSGALVDEETGVRGYVLAGEREFLKPYVDGRATEAKAVRRLRRLAIPDDARRLRSDLAAVQLRAGEWRLSYAQPTIRRVAAQGPSAVRDARVSAGKERFDAVRTALAALRGNLATARESARDRLHGAAHFLLVVLAVVAGIVFLAFVLAAGTLRRIVSAPVARLAGDVRRVARGDFGHGVEVAGPRDIAELGGDVESMRVRILQEVRSLEAAREQVVEQAQELERSNAELEQFAYVASHDLQEPLRKVASFCQALERRYGGQLDERADQYIEFAVDGAKRMQALINDLLAFSRVGRSSEPMVLLDCDELVARARANLATAIEESGARIVSEGLPAVRGDGSLLTAVFQNLIGNAVKFHGEEPPTVTLSSVRRDGEWEIVVADDGIGIEPEYAERIFVIFQRLHPKESYAGTGIGLALCRKIVEHHGGRIWLDTARERGAAFHFTLPVAEEAEDA